MRLLFETGSARGIAAGLAARIMRRLDALEAAKVVYDLSLPGFDLHELQGSRQGTWSLRVSGNWRITFNFHEGDAWNVNLEDYH